MVIGQRLRELREAKGFSQGDIEKRTGLLRCYTSRVENGVTVPSIETLQKYAHALGIPLYKIFYEGHTPPQTSNLLLAKSDSDWGAKGKARNELRRYVKLLPRLKERQRQILLKIAQQMAKQHKVGKPSTPH